MGDTERQKLQREHLSVVPYRQMWLPVGDMHDMIMDTLHNVLRVVPVIYRQTVSANLDKKGLEKVAQWVYEQCKVIISSDVALQTPTGYKKLNMSSETWPGSVCWQLLDHHVEILQMTFPRWETDQATLYHKCLKLWQTFLHFVTLIGAGCEDDEDRDSREEYGKLLDDWGDRVVQAYLPLASTTKKQSTTVYLHICGCHVGDLARKWGSLTKWCSQGVEAAHQWVQFFTKHRSPRNDHTAKVALTKVVTKQAMEMQHPAGRGKGRKREGGTGHMNKAKKAKHTQVKEEIKKVFQN